MSAADPPASDTGSIGMVTVAAVALFAVVAGAGMVAVTDLAVTASRARAAADGAALAGAGTSPLVAPGATDGPDAVAREVARANGADFLRGDAAAWPLRYGVTVQVAPRTAWVRRVVGPLEAQAFAGVRPRVAEPRP